MDNKKWRVVSAKIESKLNYVFRTWPDNLISKVGALIFSGAMN